MASRVPGKLHLRDWLLTLLEVNSIPGLEWVDRDQQIFAIAWRHGRKKGWTCDVDSKLFKEWAVHKRRYEPGNDDENAKLWKSRFRCALNALPDIRELKTMSMTKGENAKKIYQFLQKPYSRKSHRQTKANCACHFDACAEFQDRTTISCSAVDAMQRNIPQPYFVEQNMGSWHIPRMEIFENEDEELEWLLYETQQAMCRAPKTTDPFGEFSEENKKIEDFLTPKTSI